MRFKPDSSKAKVGTWLKTALYVTVLEEGSLQGEVMSMDPQYILKVPASIMVGGIVPMTLTTNINAKKIFIRNKL